MFSTGVLSYTALLLSSSLFVPTIAVPVQAAAAWTDDGPIDLTMLGGQTDPDWLIDSCHQQLTNTCAQIQQTGGLTSSGGPDRWNWHGAGVGCQIGYWLPTVALSQLAAIGTRCDATLHKMVDTAVAHGNFTRLSINIAVNDPNGFPTDTVKNTGVAVNANAISYIMQATPGGIQNSNPIVIVPEGYNN